MLTINENVGAFRKNSMLDNWAKKNFGIILLMFPCCFKTSVSETTCTSCSIYLNNFNKFILKCLIVSPCPNEPTCHRFEMLHSQVQQTLFKLTSIGNSLGEQWSVFTQCFTKLIIKTLISSNKSKTEDDMAKWIVESSWPSYSRDNSLYMLGTTTSWLPCNIPLQTTIERALTWRKGIWIT